MNEDTVHALNAVNRCFYEERADEFNETRERPWRGWKTLFDRIANLIAPSPVILDLGCGNGRFARFLERRGEPFTYYGVDASPLALEHAKKRLAELENIHLLRHDFITSSSVLPSSLQPKSFHLIVSFGVLHHVPGRNERLRLLTSLADSVAERGLLAYTVWRFDRFPRFVKKLVPWKDFLDASSSVLDVNQLEPGDHIMTWGSTPAYRYCHAAA